jgi:excinuclease ABC subunit A
VGSKVVEKNCVNAPGERGCVEIRGARQNNLKGIDFDLPLGKLTVVTGPSGSGKSSLAFDTIYAEGQRRYVETFSPYMRQFLERMDKPRVDDIRGMPPAIAIEQSNLVKTSRSTVGTITEINDFLKLFWARAARAFCPSCSREIRPETARSIADEVFALFSDQGIRANAVEAFDSESLKVTERDSSTALDSAQNDTQTVLITFWVAVPAQTKSRDFFEFLQQQGYLRIWLSNEIIRVDSDAKVVRLGARVQVIQDRISLSEENRARLAETIETALRFGKGKINVVSLSQKRYRQSTKPQRPFDQVLPIASEEFPFSTGWHCAHCDLDIRPPSPGLFSFNNPLGACAECRGFGRTIAIDLNRAMPDRSLSIAQGVVRVFRGQEMGESQKDLLRACAREQIDVHRPFEELTKPDQDFVINGEKRNGEYTEDDYENDRWYGVRGFFRWLESKTYKMHVRVLLSRYRAYVSCPSCEGGRYQPEALNYKLERIDRPRLVNGAGSAAPSILSLPEFAALSISDARDFLGKIEIPPSDSTAIMLRDEICARLRYLCEVGVGYLTLARSTRTLSGGEMQRVNLTTCLGASLVNTLSVMDEPSVGLHPRDVGRLVRVMHNLRDKGNTLLVVEHDEQIIRASDNLIDIGPGRGERGGELVWNGSLAGFLGGSADPHAIHQSLTRDYLIGEKSIPLPKSRRKFSSAIKITGATEHNLKNVDVEIPLGVFAAITGVSGSGKSTLIQDVLYRNLLRANGQTSEHEPGACRAVSGADRLDEIVMVDQSPLARTPRSTPILYLGLYDRVRELFAALPGAQAQGLTASAFSFNSGSGRCERCNGTGFEKIEMQFLSDLYVRCAECEGKRFQPHVLKIKLCGKSIHDVLQLTVMEAAAWFAQLGERQHLSDPLDVLEEVGLGYLRLGQPLNTLSGGESQRLRLVSHLAGVKRDAGAKARHARGSLFIFDEPTTGLHFDDVAILLQLFQRLIDAGHSLVVIEHNLEVIKCADWIIDLGPEAGDAGGEIIAAGTPEQLTKIDRSHTGRFLKHFIASAVEGSHRGTSKLAQWKSSTPNIFRAQDDEVSLRVAEEPSGGIRNGARSKPALAGEKAVRRSNAIQVHGAREHNLKNIHVTIPRDQMVVITGLSGSGKSTLAFDILFSEGQRRFLDSMSPYARQFVEQLEKPDVDLVEGLPPSVAIEQRVTRGGGKSTVATVTEVYHFLRLLFAKTGTQFCPDCNLPVEKQTLAAIVKQMEAAARRGPLKVLAPLVKARKGFHTDVARWAERNGFDTLFVDGQFIPVGRFRRLERFKEHTIDVVVGVIDRKRVAKARNLSQRALEIGRGTARLIDAKNQLTVMSTEMSCAGCGRAFEELDPRLFSFNSPHGACEECGGFGEIWNQALQTGESEGDESALENELVAERESEWIDESEAQICPACDGSRLNAIARHVRVENMTIDNFTALSAAAAAKQIGRLKFNGKQKTIADELLPEIVQRLRFMDNVGLGYLSLGRSAKTLSGGESQRIRLAAQLGSNLRGVLYVLDEPTIGLHSRDNVRLLETLSALREKGNSLIIVEHDEATMRRADHIIDLGPRAGIHGGEIVASGPLSVIERTRNSETGRCLNNPLCHPIRKSRRSLRQVEGWIEIRKARANNLKNIDVKFPVGRLSVITGISGSGKSTLMGEVLLPAVCEQLNRKRARVGELFDRVGGVELIDAVYQVDQSPIGKTSRSTPATYVKVFDEIRNLYAQVPVARMRGYSASRFSFNAEGGRCESCKGQGVIKLEMNFLPSTYVPCEDCGGKRYNAQTLEVLYHEKSIGDVMDMTLEEAAEFFKAHPKIARSLFLLVDTGLGYLKLGQPSPTLSGGEAQRLKLATELTRGIGRAQNERIRKMRRPKSTLYLLEEPTIGLHMADVELLLKLLHRLVDDGHTVIVIEHNLSVIAEADYIVDIGPEAGDAGGEIVVTGTPEAVSKNAVSRTAPFLREVLATKNRDVTSVRNIRTDRTATAEYAS